VQRARSAWREAQPALDPKRLVFLDESGVNSKMARLRGRCRKGARLVAAIPHGHWQTLTFIAALRHDRVDAPMVLDGAMDGPAFLTYVRHFLVPTLAPGDLVIADNLGVHKSQAVREAIEAAGASICFLPPYSPDLNPIELLFAKLKALLKKAARRTIDDLVQAIGQALDGFTPIECANYLRHAGYAST
jgi:transposase